MDPNGQLMDIGTVAAANIVRALDLAPTEANVVAAKKAIRDEVSAMSTHFTLAFADISTAHEIAQASMKAGYDKSVAEIRSTFNYVKANKGYVVAALFSAFSVGAIAVALIR